MPNGTQPLDCINAAGFPEPCSAYDLGQMYNQMNAGNINDPYWFWGQAMAPYMSDMYNWATPYDEVLGGGSQGPGGMWCNSDGECFNTAGIDWWLTEGQDPLGVTTDFDPPNLGSQGLGQDTPWWTNYGWGDDAWVPTMSLENVGETDVAQQWITNPEDAPYGTSNQMQLPNQWIDPIFSIMANYGGYFSNLGLDPVDLNLIRREGSLNQQKLLEDYKTQAWNRGGIGASGFSGVGSTAGGNYQDLMSDYIMASKGVTSNYQSNLYSLYSGLGGDIQDVISTIGDLGAFDPYSYQGMSLWGGDTGEGSFWGDLYPNLSEEDLEIAYANQLLEGGMPSGEYEYVGVGGPSWYMEGMSEGVDPSADIQDCLSNAQTGGEWAACWQGGWTAPVDTEG